MGGTFWFFKTLFGITVLYALIDFSLKVLKLSVRIRHFIHLMLGIVFLGLSFYCNKNNLLLSGIWQRFQFYIQNNYGGWLI